MAEPFASPTENTWKTPTLSGAVRFPRTGEKPSQLVIYLHGMGGTGHSNVWFVEALQDAMPGAVFYVPDGLEPIDGNEETRQWFSIPKGFRDSWLTVHPDKLPPHAREKLEQMYENYNPAALRVVEFIRERMEFHGITAKDTYVFGVSQGAMLGVQLIAESDLLADETPEGELIPLGGVMIIAGCLLNAAEVEAHPSRSKPAFVLVHGSEDTTVPYKGHLLTDRTLFKTEQKTVTKVIWDKDHTFFEYQAMPDIIRLASEWGRRPGEKGLPSLSL